MRFCIFVASVDCSENTADEDEVNQTFETGSNDFHGIQLKMIQLWRILITRSELRNQCTKQQSGPSLLIVLYLGGLGPDLQLFIPMIASSRVFVSRSGAFIF